MPSPVPLPDVVAAIVAAIGVSIVPIEAARLVHEEQRRGGVRVDYLVGSGRMMRMMLEHRRLVAGGQFVGRHRMLAAGRGGQLLLAGARGRHLDGSGAGGGYCRRRVGAGRGVMQSAMAHVGHMWLRAARVTVHGRASGG